MVSSIQWMNDKYYLSRNPFPEGGIFSEGSGEPSENGEIYLPGINKTEFAEYVQKFVITPSIGKGSGVGALWSLGLGTRDSEARGYGKSVLGNYVSREISKDFGHSILSENGFKGNPDTQIIGSYATFKKQVDTGFNAIAFRLTEFLCKPQKGHYTVSPVSLLRLKILATMKNKPSDPSGLKEAIKTEVRTFRAIDPRFSGTTLGPMNSDFLECLASENPTDSLLYLRKLTPQSIWRNGFTLLDTVLTFAMRAGISKAILFVDQVEDFAAPDTGRAKKLKEVERFRDALKETCPFNSTAFFILTMHPRAREEIWDLWRDARLPSIDPPIYHGSPENETRVMVLQGIQTLEEAKSLIEAYLQYREYRLPGSPSPLHPFTEKGIEALRLVNGKRPGYMLAHARDLIDLAAARNIETITEEFVKGTDAKLPKNERLVAKVPQQEVPEELR